MEAYLFLIIFLLGFLMGGIVTAIIVCTIMSGKDAGNLIVDNRDQDGPFMFLELGLTPDEIAKRKHVTMTVKNRGYLE